MNKSYVPAKYICLFNEWWMKPLMNWNGDRKNTVWTKKIKYDPTDDKVYLNICEPKNRTGKLPVFVYIHGGGWVSGSPEGREGIVEKVVTSGRFGLSIFYGYSPQYAHPKPIENIYKALGWLVDNAEKFDLDLSDIVVGGESAGAHLTATVGAISSNEQYKACFNLSEKSRDLKFSALLLICGIYDMNEAARSRFPFIKSYIYAYYRKPMKGLAQDEEAKTMSPLFYLNSDYPKSYVVSASGDALRHGTTTLLGKFDELKVQYKHFYANKGLAIHAFAVAQKLTNSQNVMREWLEFIK